MPVMTGDELVKRVREEGSLQSLPIVVVSSMGEDAQVTELLRSGANDYVVKPFKREILVARVKSQIHARKTADWIAKNEKVIELGFLAGGMAHQIRNGLNSLQNQVNFQSQMVEQLLEESQSLPEAVRSDMKEKLKKSKDALDRALHRIENLTASVRAYSSGSQQQTDMKLSDVVEIALTLHQDAIKQKAIHVEKEGLKSLRFSAYSSFHEVLVNLIGNAIDAVKKDGTGKISILGREVGGEIEVTIEDNGVGIESDILSKLCQPFFTTKSPGEGTGLGLYVVRDIVEGQHRGKLEIHSGGRDKGATFVVRIPKKAPEVSKPAEVIIHGVTVS